MCVCVPSISAVVSHSIIVVVSSCYGENGNGIKHAGTLGFEHASGWHRVPMCTDNFTGLTEYPAL